MTESSPTAGQSSHSADSPETATSPESRSGSPAAENPLTPVAEALQPDRRSSALHKIALTIVFMVWPLIWVGAMVTTYEAGMAVPDWPGTYGYNLFLYPYQTWLTGPFDLFIEHGHRLLAALVGMVAILAVAVAFASEPRRWVRLLTVAVLTAICLQGALGGARVVLADRGLAMLHGCVAQFVFALCVSAAVVTGRWWQQAGLSGALRADVPGHPVVPGRVMISAVALLVLISYVQVVFGALLRHAQPTASPGGFTHIVAAHITTAFIILFAAIGIVAVLNRRRRKTGAADADEAGGAVSADENERQKSARCGDLTLLGPGVVLVIFSLIQISLGLATWAARYGLPPFAQIGPRTASYLVESRAFSESLIITAHVGVGALVLVSGVVLLLRMLRLDHVQRLKLRAGTA